MLVSPHQGLNDLGPGIPSRRVAVGRMISEVVQRRWSLLLDSPRRKRHNQNPWSTSLRSAIALRRPCTHLAVRLRALPNTRGILRLFHAHKFRAFYAAPGRIFFFPSIFTIDLALDIYLVRRRSFA